MSGVNSFGELIRRARERLGWTQDEVADKVKASRVTVNRWEQDLQHTAVRYLKPLIDTLDLNEKEAYALYYTGGKTPPERHKLPLDNRFFTGREGYLEELPKLLQEHHVVALSGLGGIGKTQIALEYAHSSHPDMYPAVLWVNAADTATLRADFAALTETLELPEWDEQEPKLRIKAVKKWFETHTDWLLIMDNADELPIVEPFLLSKPHGHILLTTRWQFPEKFAKPLEIGAMGTEEGVRFLLRRTRKEKGKKDETAVDNLTPDVRAAARQVVEELGGHALALEQAGAYIQQTGTSFENYLNLYRKNRRSLLSKYGALDDDHVTVAATFQTSLAKAHERAPLAEDILHFCAFLQPDAIPEELFQYEESFTSDSMAFNKGMAALQRYSLVRHHEQEKAFSLHRLVQAVLVDNMSVELQKRWREHVAQSLHAAFREAESLSPTWRQLERLLPHGLVCTTWDVNELTHSGAIDVFCVIAGLIEILAFWDKESLGLDLPMRALTVFTQVFGAKDSDSGKYTLKLESGNADLAQYVVLVLSAWGDALLRREEYDAALMMYRSVLDMSSDLGARDYANIKCLPGLSQIYLYRGREEQIETILMDLLPHLEEHLSAGDPCIPPMINALAASYFLQGKDEQLELLYRRVSTFLNKQGLEDSNITSLFSGVDLMFAFLLCERGQMEQAKELLQRVLNSQEFLLGPNHPIFQKVREKAVALIPSILEQPEQGK